MPGGAGPGDIGVSEKVSVNVNEPRHEGLPGQEIVLMTHLYSPPGDPGRADSSGQRQATAIGNSAAYSRGLWQLGHIRPVKARPGIEAVPLRLLPILLPRRWATPVPDGQLWNVGPAHGPQQTILDGLPQPTDLMVHDP